jgi:small subunit ribosomal protein S4
MKTTGPKLKRVRALGEDFAMSGDRSLAAKYLKLNRKQPPGAHGKKRGFSKITGYGIQLKEKQKARTFYLLSEHQLRKYYDLASRQTISTDIALLSALERRLDNVLYRAGFTDSHAAARQLISHAHFSINGRKVNIPSYSVKAGDEIAFRGKSPKLADFVKDKVSGNHPVSWLKVDPAKLTISVVNLPARGEVEVPFNEQLIIEFYSR